MAASKTILLDEQAWSSSGNLFFPGLDGADVLRQSAAITLQAEFKKLGFYTLQFGIQPPPTLANGFDVAGNIFTTADIQWSVKGNTIRRFINVYNGTTISGAGEAITVRVRDVSDPISFIEVPTKYQVTASLIPGARPSLANGMPPIFTPRTLIESPGSGAGVALPPPYVLEAGTTPLIIPVPQNCGITSLMLNIASEATEASDPPQLLTNQRILIEHRNSSARLNMSNYDAAYNFQPLVPGTTEIYVYNIPVTEADVNPTVWVTPIFGVDG